MRTKTKIIIFLALLLIFCISIGTFFYFSAKKKSPEYSLNLLNTAIKQHDYATFERHIDLESFYGHSFEDVIAPSLKQPSDVGANDFLASIMASVKQSFISAMIEKTQTYVESGSLDTDASLTDQALVKNFTELTDFRNTTFKSIDSVTIDGNLAYADVMIHHTTLDEDFVLKLKLKRLDDETWCVVNIDNMQEFLAAITKKKNEKLTELNKPLASKINDYIEIIDSKPELKVTTRHDLTSYAFFYSNKVAFKSDKQIVEFAGQIDIHDQDKNLVFSQKFINAGPFPKNSTQEFRFSWPLNPFIPSEKILINTPLAKLNVTTKILCVKFADNSELHLLTTMPGSK
ncbi:MAG TPA: hypothetical protein IAB06_00810 [Candidatus Avacidaminococcus intestinavium]|uniref:Uncharacterized protein n=1 Tax=Candidatus Avacidaminococcus intestinavium TaxID=2840684 RepID=A0A9D1MNH8_9FIRM|nr:hypothetical protein [Candidatus Avacidaminococcus intestinavium]